MLAVKPWISYQQRLDQTFIKCKTDRPDLDGGAIDIHKWFGKLPRPKSGFTPAKYKYMGPHNLSINN